MSDERCRLCTTNDRDALVEELAGELWDVHRDRSLGDRSWEDAGSYWQPAFRAFARVAVEKLRPRA